MERLFVYADFNWLGSPELIGELFFDSVRGNEIYGFTFHKDWLSQYREIFLSADLQNFHGA